MKNKDFLILLIPSIIVSILISFFEVSSFIMLIIFIVIVFSLPLVASLKTKGESNILDKFKVIFKKKLSIVLMMRMYFILLALYAFTIVTLYIKGIIMKLITDAIAYNNFDIYSDAIGFVSQLDYFVNAGFFIFIVLIILFVFNYFYNYYLITIVNDNLDIKTPKKKKKRAKIFYYEFHISRFLYIFLTQVFVVCIYWIFKDNSTIAEVFHPRQTTIIYFIIITIFIYMSLLSIYVYNFKNEVLKNKVISLVLLAILCILPIGYMNSLQIENVELTYDSPEVYAQELFKYSDIDSYEEANIVSNLLYSIYKNDIAKEVSEEIDKIEIESETTIDPIYGDLLALKENEVEYVYLYKVEDNIYQFQTQKLNMYISTSTYEDSSTVYDLIYHSNIADYLLTKGENPYWLSDSSRETCAFEIDDDCNTEVPILISNVELYNVTDDVYSTRFVDSNVTVSQNILKQLAAFDVYLNVQDANSESLKMFSTSEEAKEYIVEYEYIYIHTNEIENGYDYNVSDFEDDLELEEGGFKLLMDNIYGPNETLNFRFYLKYYNDYSMLFNATNLRATEGQ